MNNKDNGGKIILLPFSYLTERVTSVEKFSSQILRFVIYPSLNYY